MCIMHVPYFLRARWPADLRHKIIRNANKNMITTPFLISQERKWVECPPRNKFRSVFSLSSGDKHIQTIVYMKWERTWRVVWSRGLSKGITWKLKGSPGTLSINIRFEHCNRKKYNGTCYYYCDPRTLSYIWILWIYISSIIMHYLYLFSLHRTYWG